MLEILVAKKMAKKAGYPLVWDAREKSWRFGDMTINRLYLTDNDEQDFAELLSGIAVRVAKAEYNRLAALATKAEEVTGKYLHDVCIDRENAAVDERDPEFWPNMVRSLRSSFGMRCEEFGLKATDFGISY